MHHTEVFPSFSDAFDDYMGIYNKSIGLPLPDGLRNALYYLVSAWGGLYFIMALFSSFYYGSYTGEGCPRVAVALGCLYRKIDKWYNIVPRVTTCTMLHYTLAHVALNSYSVGSSFALALNNLDNAAWIYYWAIPVWFICSLTGSLVSLTGHLATVASFTVGASGGACGMSIFSSCLMFMITDDSYSGASSDSRILGALQTIIMVVLQSTPVATISTGKKVDWQAHLGGTMMGFGLAYVLTHMIHTWDEISCLRLGAVLTVAAVAWIAICFFFVFCQFMTTHQERVTQCYIAWIELDKIDLIRSHNQTRRFTIDHMRNVERRLARTERKKRIPYTDDEKLDNEEWAYLTSHRYDPNLIYHNARQSTAY